MCGPTVQGTISQILYELIIEILLKWMLFLNEKQVSNQVPI